MKNIAVIMFAFLVVACGSQKEPQKLPAPSAAQIAFYDNENLADSLRFETAQTVESNDFGLVGDGVTDNTDTFVNLLGTGNRTVHITEGDYVTGKLNIPSRTILILDPGTIIRDSGNLGINERLLNIVRVQDVRIEGMGAKIIANRTDYTSGEQRHGVFIFRANRVVITGVNSSSHGGDGFYIGDTASDVVLQGVLASDNRRQGLSITSASRVRVLDSDFTNTNGTAPEAGIDIEPNNAKDPLNDIVILRPFTAGNQGGGVDLFLDKLDDTSSPVSIFIIEHESNFETRLQTKIPDRFIPMIFYSQGD